MSEEIIDIDFQEIIRIVSNEKCAPTLLPYQDDFIEPFEKMIFRQEQAIKDQKNQLNKNQLNEVKLLEAKELEVHRWKYFLRSYHEARLHKIQQIVSKGQRPNTVYLSEAEKKYCDMLIASMAKALGPNISPESFLTSPDNLDSFVFFEALDDIGSTLLSGSVTNQPLDISKGTIYFSRFQYVQEYVGQGRAMLV